MPTKWFLMLAAAAVIGFGAVAATSPAPRPEQPEVETTPPTRVHRPAAGWTPPPPRLGFRLPPITLEDLEGHEVPLSTFRGKVVVLHLFGTWCDPCKEEMPELVKLATRLAGQDFALLGVATESTEVLQASIAEHGLNYPVLRDVETQLRQALETDTIPRTVVLDREGTVVAHLRGYHGDIQPLHQELRKLGLPL